MKRLARVFDGIELNLVHVTGQAPTGGEHFHKILPLGLRIAAKAGAQRPVAISLGSDLKRGIEGAKLGELAVEGEMHKSLDR